MSIIDAWPVWPPLYRRHEQVQPWNPTCPVVVWVGGGSHTNAHVGPLRVSQCYPGKGLSRLLGGAVIVPMLEPTVDSIGPGSARLTRPNLSTVRGGALMLPPPPRQEYTDTRHAHVKITRFTNSFHTFGRYGRSMSPLVQSKNAWRRKKQ